MSLADAYRGRTGIKRLEHVPCLLDRIFAHDRQIGTSQIKIISQSIGYFSACTVCLNHANDIGFRPFNHLDDPFDAYLFAQFMPSVEYIESHQVNLRGKAGQIVFLPDSRMTKILFGNLLAASHPVGKPELVQHTVEAVPLVIDVIPDAHRISGSQILVSVGTIGSDVFPVIIHFHLVFLGKMSNGQKMPLAVVDRLPLRRRPVIPLPIFPIGEIDGPRAVFLCGNHKSGILHIVRHLVADDTFPTDIFAR